MLYQCLQLMRRWLRGAEQGVKSGQPFLDAIPGSCDQNSLERGKKPLKSAGERYICQKQYLLGTQGDSAAWGPIQIQTACCAEKQFQWLSRVRRERKGTCGPAAKSTHLDPRHGCRPLRLTGQHVSMGGVLQPLCKHSCAPFTAMRQLRRLQNGLCMQTWLEKTNYKDEKSAPHSEAYKPLVVFLTI